MMQVSGKGALGVWHGIGGLQQREAEEWYNREHHAERVAIPGFLRARRYVNRGAGPRYFSRYDTTDAAVLASAAYRNALNSPSAWSNKIFPHYRDTVRGVFEVAARFGSAEGGFLLSLRFDEADAPADASLLELAQRLIEHHGVLGTEVWCIERSVTTQPTREKDLRAKEDSFPARVLLVESSAPEFAAEAIAAAAVGLAALAATDVYQLVFQKIGTDECADDRPGTRENA